MHLLQSGEPIEGIALWLGHESPTSTHQYVEANLAMKEQALAKLQLSRSTGIAPRQSYLSRDPPRRWPSRSPPGR